MLRHMSAQDKICSENDQTLVEICTVEYFGSDICQIKLGFVQIKSALMSDCYFMLCSGYSLIIKIRILLQSLLHNYELLHTYVNLNPQSNNYSSCPYMLQRTNNREEILERIIAR